MDDALGGLTAILEAGMWILLKYALLYILLPEIVAIVLFGFILRIRGTKFKLIMAGISILILAFFLWFGLPNLAEETMNLNR